MMSHPLPQVPALLAKDVQKGGGRIMLDSPVHLITQVRLMMSMQLTPFPTL